MKKIILFMSFMAISLTSCSEDSMELDLSNESEKASFHDYMRPPETEPVLIPD